ncbi:MAG: FtsW/RodA/SpoVE family cell cycle protein [Bacteroidaceae bacterium]|nr:FtsW/RodA/SpoVE family cell cycle protein [Bacteroidaceae bacterium]
MAGIVSSFFHGKMFKGDKTVWMIYFILCMISLVEVYSASSRLTFSGASHWKPFINQIQFLGAGFLIILVFHRLPCKWYNLFPPPLYIISMMMLAYTALSGGSSLNGTHRWIYIGPFTVQPSEFVKCFLIMWTAMVLARTQTVIKTENGKVIMGAVRGKPWQPFALVAVPLMLSFILIFMDNVSTALMLFVVIFVMMIIGRVPWVYLLKGLGGLGLIGGFVMTLAFLMPEEALVQNGALKRLATVKHRVERFTKGEENVDPYDATYWFNDKNSQSTHAKIAIANSNIIGRGPGNSIQRDFLQHAESDFIFSIIVEEFGLAGGLFVLSLYIALFVQTGRIAQKCRSFFPAYLVLGFGMMMTLQALVNMAVAVGAIPVTGQTLPFISRGGTSILINSFYIAVILSVSRYANAVPQDKKNSGDEHLDVEEPSSNETYEFATEGNMR